MDRSQSNLRNHLASLVVVAAAILAGAATSIIDPMPTWDLTGWNEGFAVANNDDFAWVEAELIVRVFLASEGSIEWRAPVGDVAPGETVRVRYPHLQNGGGLVDPLRLGSGYARLKCKGVDEDGEELRYESDMIDLESIAVVETP